MLIGVVELNLDPSRSFCVFEPAPVFEDVTVILRFSSSPFVHDYVHPSVILKCASVRVVCFVITSPTSVCPVWSVGSGLLLNKYLIYILY